MYPWKSEIFVTPQRDIPHRNRVDWQRYCLEMKQFLLFLMIIMPKMTTPRIQARPKYVKRIRIFLVETTPDNSKVVGR